MRSAAWKWLSALGAGALVALMVVPVAAQARGASEPPATGQSWYWEDQTHQEVKDPVGNTYTVEGPNPFCPSAPGDLGAPGQTCAPGRLPIEIQGGDYDTPNKLSAVNFDFSLVPIGSTIKSFKVTFLEAKPGCYDQDGDGQPSQGDRCENTGPVNLDQQQLQACQVNEFFGNGAARPYNEAPKYQCAEGDPTAERKEAEVKGAEEPLNDTETDHVWTFDLTPLAKKWSTGTTVSSIMLVGAPPKDYNPDQKNAQDDWRVVLAGPQAKQGIVTSLQFTAPASVPTPPPTDPGVDTGTDTGTTTDFGSGTTGFGTGTTGSTDFGSGTTTGGTDPTGTGGVAPAPAASPIAAAGPAPASPEEFPAYMWLAILAGLIGFFLVRSVVIETTTGVRPNGVLAQIKSLNAQRKGAEVAEGAEAGGVVTGALGSVGEGFSSVARRVTSAFKRG